MAFLYPQNMAKTLLIHADSGQYGHILDLATPAAFQHDAVEVDIGILTLDGLGSPALYVSVNLLVEL